MKRDPANMTRADKSKLNVFNKKSVLLIVKFLRYSGWDLHEWHWPKCFHYGILSTWLQNDTCFVSVVYSHSKLKLKSYIFYYSRSIHYSTDPIFPFITADDIHQPITDPIQAATYHPSILRSPPFASSVSSTYTTEIGEQKINKWHRLDRFGSQSYPKTSHVLFCGGAVRSLDWMPQSKDKDLQYLLVSCQTNAEEIPYINSSTPSKMCLQLYQLDTANQSMHLQYIVALDNGPIRCVAFCPSGGSDSATKRLAILAVPMVSGDIQILALTSPTEIPIGSTIRISPSVVLQSGSNSGQVTRIVWSKVISIHW